MGVCFGLAESGYAQNVVAPTDATEVLNETLLQSSPIAKTYMARVLLENKANWKESYELLRDVLKNHKDEIPSVVFKKISRAAKQVARYMPETYVREKINARHLIRPFLEAQYLLNEALMDWRPALNSSSDSESVFVEKLLQSYFFPGFEDRGVILYPEQANYAFDIFALTPENVQRARRHMSTDKDPRQGSYNNRYPTSPSVGIPSSGGGSPYIPRPPGVPGSTTPVPPFNPPGGSSGSSVPVSPWPRPPGNTTGAGAGRGPVDWDNPAFNMKLYKANGFIDDALQSGIDLGDITEEVVRIIKQFKIEDRVTNRYLEQSLLMQAIADPGSILFDPQLQEFLKGIRLSVYLGDMPANSANGTNEWDLLKDVLGEKLVTRDKEGNVRIKMSGLVGEERAGSQDGLEIRLSQVQGSDRQALYVLSGVAGPDLLRLRTFMSIATLFRDWDQSTSLARKVGGAISRAQAYQLLTKFGKLVIDFSKVGARDAGRVLMWMIRIVYYTIEAFPGVKPQSIQEIRELLRTAALTISRGGVEKFTKFFQWMNPRVQKTFNYAKNQKYIKNGAAAYGLLGLALAAETFIITAEYRQASDPNEKYKIWQEGGAKLGATLTYALPVVGMGAAIVDLSHTFLKLPFETADAFRFYTHTVEDMAYEHYAGMNKTEFDLLELQSSLNLPRNAFYIERLSKKVTGLQMARERMIELDQQIQDISSRYLILLYLAHSRIVPGRNNTFGRKQEDYMTEFSGNLLSYTKTRAEMIELLVKYKDDQTPARDDMMPEDPKASLEKAETQTPPPAPLPAIQKPVTLPPGASDSNRTNNLPSNATIPAPPFTPPSSSSTNRAGGSEVVLPGKGPTS